MTSKVKRGRCFFAFHDKDNYPVGRFILNTNALSTNMSSFNNKTISLLFTVFIMYLYTYLKIKTNVLYEFTIIMKQWSNLNFLRKEFNHTNKCHFIIHGTKSRSQIWQRYLNIYINWMESVYSHFDPKSAILSHLVIKPWGVEKKIIINVSRIWNIYFYLKFFSQMSHYLYSLWYWKNFKYFIALHFFGKYV